MIDLKTILPAMKMKMTHTTPGSSMLSSQHLLSAVKNKVGIKYHNKVERLFEFLKSHPSILAWTDFGEAIVNGVHLPGTNVHEMLDYLFHDWRKLSKQSPPQGLLTYLLTYLHLFGKAGQMNGQLYS